MNDMTLQIEMKYSYGLQTYYPLCNRSKLFAKIAGTKTLTRMTIADIKALGYTFAIKVPEVAV